MDHFPDHSADLGSIFLDDRVVRTAQAEGLYGPLLGLDPIDDAARLGN